jgi:DNA invertase Pin-like site-specific DNA recombinase/DNA-binding winged helix-turn-helix (wHTH) protein
MEAQALVPAAQYVRMSTENQEFSIANQEAVIQEYAQRHGFVVVSTYSDSGKSGVTIKHRKELRRLLHDVTSGDAQFKTILVYDVSRFGRFQDVDEAAHYEFLCRSAGIPVCYCAEQFHNDGSLASSMMKALKRTMAAEYSRELGVKVSAGQRRLTLLGYRVVGEAGYGMRRMTVSMDGQRKILLQSGEHKGIKTDRTILVPGPKEEVDGVRAIFKLAAKGRSTAKEIANELNRRRMFRTRGQPWDCDSIAALLTKEKYAGCNAYGKTTQRLSSPSLKIHRDLWVTNQNAFVPIVNKDVFDQAQAFLQRRAALRRTTDAVLIQGMKKVLAQEGRLSQRLLQKKSGFDYKTCFKRFGSMTEAYALVGYHPSARTLKFMDNFKLIEQLRYELYARLTKLFPDRVRMIRLYSQPRALQIVEIDRSVRVSVYLCRAAKNTRAGIPGWLMRIRPQEKDSLALVCTMDASFSTLLSFYLFPPLPAHFLTERMVREDTWFPAAQKLKGLDDFCDLANQIAAQPKKVDPYTSVDDILIATDTWTVIVGKESINLGPVGSAIFSMLALNAGQVVSRDRLQRCSPGKVLDTLNLNAHICTLREKLGPFGRKRILRVPKVGYMYVSPAESA